MKPPSDELEKIIAEIRKCRTQRRAIQLAAGLVLCFTKNTFTEYNLCNRFGNALCDGYEFATPEKRKP